MSLDNAYSRVSNHAVGGLGTGVPIPRERDPKLQKLESDVFSQMQQAVTPHLPPQTDVPDVRSSEVNAVGVEQALKELLDNTNSLDDKL